MWTQVVIPIVTALIGAGVFQMFFKWLSERPQNKAHQSKIWEEFKTETLTTVKGEKAELVEKLELHEYRHSLRDQLERLVFDELDDAGADRDKVTRYWNTSREIRFVKSLDDARKIRIE
ncbi:membrane protein [Gordonia phage LittleFella]|nr:membrane protein [Gordonia phage LittleFella]